jgi:hypothetical protein
VDNARNYAFEFATSLTDADWKGGAYSSSTKGEITGLESGKRYWIRARAQGTNDLFSDWSDPVSQLVN